MTRREVIPLMAAPVAARAAGVSPSVLVHEHVLVDFIGAGEIRPGRYDAEEVFRAARPKLQEVQRLGCRRLVECTPNFLGRDAGLMRRLSDAVGMDIWINTGIYGAGKHRYVPEYALKEPAELLARRWMAESRTGVEGIKPRFIKTGVTASPLDELDRKLIRAAAIASRETGLTAASHTGAGVAALEQIEIFASEKASPSRFVWVHAQSEKDHTVHEKAARLGAWVELDGIGPKTAAWHLECVRFMAGKQLLGRVLLSQDSGWYHVGEPGGGDYRGYAYIYTDFLPKLDPAWVSRLMWENPRKAFGR